MTNKLFHLKKIQHKFEYSPYSFGLIRELISEFCLYNPILSELLWRFTRKFFNNGSKILL